MCYESAPGIVEVNPSKAYLMSLLGKLDIVVLSEHRFCPYFLYELDDLTDFARPIASEENPKSDLTRGCGRVAITWRKSVCTISMHVGSDRNVAIKVRTACTDPLTIVGTYNDTGLPLGKYTECLAVLKNKMTRPYIPFSI